ncbi:MAG: Gfo/Idh/MocA family oxidoreductase [Clostridiales bacterium]|nr:Gfo/Idh/MocA family oxidoreductase [Clostridiales bacterium]
MYKTSERKSLMINFGVIGRNFVVDRMLEASKQISDINLLSVYSRNADTAEEFANKHGAERAYTDFDAFCRDDELDFVYIASPNICHTKQAVTLLNAGKHVLCEKPAAPSEGELSEMLSAAEKNDRVFMEAMMSAHLPAVGIIKDKLSEIGPVRRATLSYCQYSSRYDKFKSGIIENAFDPRLCNGAMMDIGIYCIHMAAMLFGEPDEVCGSAVFLPESIDGEGSLVLKYDGMLAEIIYSKIADGCLPSQIEGENGCILIDALSKPRVITVLPRGKEKYIIDTSDDKHDMYYELRDFINQISGERTREYNEYSMKAIRIADRARKETGVDFKIRPRP